MTDLQLLNSKVSIYKIKRLNNTIQKTIDSLKQVQDIAKINSTLLKYHFPKL